jgi:hypothetical protein
VRVRFRPRAALRPGGGGTSGGSGGAGWADALDYSNGGPFFLAPSGAADWGYPEPAGSSGGSSGGDGGAGGGVPGVEVLARYVALPPGALSRVDPTCRGGDGGRAEEGRAVAAVRCAVGAGAAVLCGTHPELEPRWLDACGVTPAGVRSQDDDAVAAAAAAALGLGAAAVAAAAPLPAARPRAVAAAAVAPAVGVWAPAAAAAAAPSPAGAVGAAAVAAAAAAAAACPDAALAHHTAALAAALEEHQAGRDELLRALLLAALAHQGGPGPAALAAA